MAANITNNADNIIHTDIQLNWNFDRIDNLAAMFNTANRFNQPIDLRHVDWLHHEDGPAVREVQSTTWYQHTENREDIPNK